MPPKNTSKVGLEASARKRRSASSVAQGEEFHAIPGLLEERLPQGLAPFLDDANNADPLLRLGNRGYGEGGKRKRGRPGRPVNTVDHVGLPGVSDGSLTAPDRCETRPRLLTVA